MKRNSIIKVFVFFVIVTGIVLLRNYIFSADVKAQTQTNPLDYSDQRMGIGGNGSVLGIPWAYSWGHGEMPNDSEISMMKSGVKVFFTVGKLDDAESNRIECVDGSDVSKCKGQVKIYGRSYYRDFPANIPQPPIWNIAPTDTLAQLLVYPTVAPFSTPKPTRTQLPDPRYITKQFDPLKEDRIQYTDEKGTHNVPAWDVVQQWCKSGSCLASYPYIEYLATVPHPGVDHMVYAFDNEPDLPTAMHNLRRNVWEDPDYIKKYVLAYEIFYRKVKRHDPNALFMIKGLTSGGGDVSYQTENIPNHENFIRRYHFSFDTRWLTLTMAQYEAYFHKPMPIDIWGIHDYAGNDLNTFVANIKSFKNAYLPYLQQKYVGKYPSVSYVNTPIWILEFGDTTSAVNSKTISPQDQDKLFQATADTTMNSEIGWLKGEGSSYIQKWFWFVLGSTGWNGDIYPYNFPTRYPVYPNGVTPAPDYNVLGIRYAKLSNAETPLLLNKSFESSITQARAWSFWNGNIKDNTYSVDTTTRHNPGFTSVRINLSDTKGPYGKIASIYQARPFHPQDGRLQLSGWCKSSDGNGKAALKINYTNSKNVRNTYYAKSVAQNFICPQNDWAKISTGFVEIPSDIKNIEYDADAYTAKGPETVWLDGFNAIIKQCPHFLEGDVLCTNNVPKVNPGQIATYFQGQNKDFFLDEAENKHSQTSDLNNDGKVSLDDIEKLRKKLNNIQ